MADGRAIQLRTTKAPLAPTWARRTRHPPRRPFSGCPATHGHGLGFGRAVGCGATYSAERYKTPNSSGSSGRWLIDAKDKASQPRLLEDHYDVGDDVLGSGGYGVVRLAVCKATGKRVAVKTVRKKPAHFTGRMSLYKIKVQTEFKAHLSLGKSLDVAYAYEAFEDDSEVHLVLELCSGGTLLTKSFLRTGEYTEKRVALVLRSALRSVIQCHVHDVVFRDIKPENFLWTEQGHLKLTDFGMAAFCTTEERLNERCGTLSFLAPEVVRQDYGHACDVWSIGVMAYLLLSGRYPFTDEEGNQKVGKEVWRSVLYQDPDLESDPWPRVSQEAKDFVGALLEKDETKRITAEEALAHPFVRVVRGPTGAEGTEELAEGTEPPLEESLVARLQRFGLYSKLKQALLQKMLKYVNVSGSDGDGNGGGGGGGGGGVEENEEVGKVNAFLKSLDIAGNGTVRVEDLLWMLSSGGYDLEADEWTQICSLIDAERTQKVRIEDLAPHLLDWPKIQQADQWTLWVTKMYESLCSRETCDVLSVEDLVKYVCEFEDEACSLEMVDEIVKCLGSSEAHSIELDNFFGLLKSRDSELLSYYDSRTFEFDEEISMDASL